MADDVKPALTASEWAQAAGFTGTFVYDVIFGRGKTDGEYRHAHAAVALYGQPFGFTREDVERIKWVLEEIPEMSSWVDPGGWLDDSLRNLAARIEALLPPEPTDG